MKVGKKTILLMAFVILSVFMFGCAKIKQTDQGGEEPGNQQQIDTQTNTAAEITGGITEVDQANDDLNVDDVDADLNSIDEELSNW